MNKSTLLAAGLMASAAIFAVIGCDGVESQQADSTSCEGATLDGNGRCRKPSGQFAKKVCCQAQTPQVRRSLDSYVCPSGSADIPVAFFDADSTLRISRSGSPSANNPTDVYVLPFAADAIHELNEQGYLVAIVSNQGGVGAGYIELEDAEGALVFTASQLHKAGGKVDYIDFAENKDDYRKPKVGMATLLETKLQQHCGVGIDMAASFMVGDAGYKKDVDGPHPDGRPADDFSNSDRGFADNLDIPFSEPTDYFDWRHWDVYNIRHKSTLFDLYEALELEIDELEQSGADEDRLELLSRVLETNRAVNEL